MQLQLTSYNKTAFLYLQIVPIDLVSKNQTNSSILLYDAKYDLGTKAL